MNSQHLFSVGLLFLTISQLAFSAGLPGRPTMPSSFSRQPVHREPEKEGNRRLSKTPLYFEPNVGQSDPAVRYVARGGGFVTLLTGTEAVFLNSNTRQPMRLQFSGATFAGDSRAVPSGPLPGFSNYFYGKDPARWRTDIPHYRKVRFENVYRGIDVVYYSTEGRLEYDLVVQAGADPSSIELAWTGADSIRVDKSGDLLISTSGGDVRQKRPVVYQHAGGRRVPVKATYVARNGNRFGIELEPFNPDYALVIDPVIYYSTYMGGNQADDITAVAVDRQGYALVTGSTNSVNYPIVGPAAQTQFGNQGDAFVTRIAPTGDFISYSTFLGGEAFDRGTGIAVDSLGFVYVTGYTNSFAFPVTARAYQHDFSGVTDAFITKLNINGNALVYSTFLGTGDTYENGTAIAVDASGRAVVAGTTNSVAFPTTPGAYSSTFKGGYDGFLVKLETDGSQLLFSTLFGGVFDDTPNAIALDPAGNVYITGGTTSADFPTTPGAYRTTSGGLSDAFLLKFSLDGKRLLFSTLLGSSGDDAAFAMSIEPGGRIAIAGRAGAADFPTTARASSSVFGGIADGFVARFNSTGSVLIACSLISTPNSDFASGVFVQEGGFLAVAGYTESNNFPTTSDAFQFSNNFSGDMFFVTLQPLANAVKFSTVYGGFGQDAPRAMAPTPESDVVIAGVTYSNNFPVSANAIFRTPRGGQGDGFVTRINEIAVPECQNNVSPTGTAYSSGGGGGGIAVADGCQWNAFSTAPWITITPAGSVFGFGAGSLNYVVGTNSGSEPRTGAIYVAGNLVPVIQKGTSGAGSFSDVPVTDQFADFIRLIRNQGVTTGCGGNAYCPNDNVPRWQMAVFLIRGMIGSDDFPYPATPYFQDVPTTHPQFKWIQKLRELNVTTGCGDGIYCPNDPVSRGQMATFLIRSRYGATFNYTQTPFFTDVGVSHPFFQYVQKLKQTGITAGCGPTTFCVDASITRAQMAVFLTRAFFTPW